MRLSKNCLLNLRNLEGVLCFFHLSQKLLKKGWSRNSQIGAQIGTHIEAMKISIQSLIS